MKKLIVIFNHTLTSTQIVAAGDELGVGRIVDPPADLATFWRQVPPELDDLASYLAPIIDWLENTCSNNDFVLIQGEFGATFLLVSHCLARGWQPIYSTTSRQADEVHKSDGTVELRHSFQHVRFRKYQQAAQLNL